MSRFRRLLAALPLLGALVAVGLAGAAPLPTATSDVVKDHASFVPQRKYFALPGKTVGVLIGNVQAMMGQEGRGGPPEAMGFSLGGGSYRWVYVPVTEKPLITNLSVPVGEKGGAVKNYPSLSMAFPQTVKQWGIPAQASLVEMQVNDGLGSPAGESFVATNMRRLDGTKEFPLVVSEVIAEMTKRYARYKEDQQKAIENALQEAARKSLKEQKPTGPRESKDLMYVTWLPEGERLVIHFRTTISDGHWQTGGGVNPGPVPLPPGRRGAPQLPAAQPGVGAAPPRAAAVFPPPPPRFEGFRWGTGFGVEFGMGYEISKSGKLERTLTLPFQSFENTIPPPPAIGPRRFPVDPVPPARLPAEKE